MIVVDASAAIELLTGGPLSSSLAGRLFAEGETLHAPHLIDVEVAQVMRRMLRGRSVDAERATEVLDDLAAMPLTRYPHQPLVPRIWTLRDNASAYDACYLALSEVLQAPIVTCDRALGRIPGWKMAVEVFT